ncbi:MAG: monovalent cation:proton antiporter-2 (CPA2) family protein [Pseudomonadota bacterium]
MATQESGFLVEAATYLGAAAIAVPIFNRFKLGSILGYLAAGVAVGPFGLKLLQQEEGVFHIAELGVVLFLFVIGLELSLSRLWSMRGQIFGLGAAQMGITGAVIAGIFIAAGVLPTEAAIIAGLSFAFSSTAFALQLLKDRSEINTEYGKRSFSILLFQDLAVIPLLAAIPFLAGGADMERAGLDAVFKAIGVIATLVVLGLYVLDRVLRMVANSGSREAFAATALLIVALTALSVQWAGLSMALGAFLAGVLLADSSYKHQIEADIEPFRGLLLGLFFISIGMRLDLGVIAENWWVVLCGASGLVLLKIAILYAVTRTAGARHENALKTAVVLSQGGEFAFVVISLGLGSGLFTNGASTLMSAIITISMVSTPPLLILAHRLTRNDSHDSATDFAGPEREQDHVIIAGFGRMGQIISQVLTNSGVKVTAIDNNASHIRNAERFGFKVYYGDASRTDILITAGVEEAKSVILCMDNTEAVNIAVANLRERFPNITILAVAHDRMHEIELQPLGADVIVRETMESSILVAREALVRMGQDERTIEDYVEQFRKRDRERLLQQKDYGPEAGMELLHTRFENSREKAGA